MGQVVELRLSSRDVEAVTRIANEKIAMEYKRLDARTEPPNLLAAEVRWIIESYIDYLNQQMKESK